jgi:hypothetical protein
MTAASVWLRSPPFAFLQGTSENSSFIGVFEISGISQTNQSHNPPSDFFHPNHALRQCSGAKNPRWHITARCESARLASVKLESAVSKMKLAGQIASPIFS